MKIKDTEIPVSFLAECFDANFDTGVLIWRERPEAHFGGRRRACAVFNGKHANKRADKPHSKGYRQVRITLPNGGRIDIFAHRVLWALKHGRWPDDQIDHENGVRDDNRWRNLREATNAEQQQNRKPTPGQSGFPGVGWSKQRRQWRVAIRLNRRARHVGFFDDFALACQASLAAKSVYHPFARPRYRRIDIADVRTAL